MGAYEKKSQDTRFVAYATNLSSKSGRVLVRIEHPREGTLAVVMEHNDAVELRNWLDNEISIPDKTSKTPLVWTVAEIAKRFKKKPKFISDIIKLTKIKPIKIVNGRTKLYSYLQIQLIEEQIERRIKEK